MSKTKKTNVSYEFLKEFMTDGIQVDVHLNCGTRLFGVINNVCEQTCNIVLENHVKKALICFTSVKTVTESNHAI